MASSGFRHLNEPAPAFTVKTTHGDRSLADYQGKRLILFSHPADFTPVCTTEFIGFAKAADTQAVQTSDANKVAAPEGWTPGCDVIVPPPKTADALAKRAGEGFKTVDWYFSTRNLEPRSTTARRCHAPI